MTSVKRVALLAGKALAAALSAGVLVLSCGEPGLSAEPAAPPAVAP